MLFIRKWNRLQLFFGSQGLIRTLVSARWHVGINTFQIDMLGSTDQLLVLLYEVVLHLLQPLLLRLDLVLYLFVI